MANSPTPTSRPIYTTPGTSPAMEPTCALMPNNQSGCGEAPSKHGIPLFPTAYGVIVAVSCVIIMVAMFGLLWVLRRKQQLAQLYAGRGGWEHGDEIELKPRQRREEERMEVFGK